MCGEALTPVPNSLQGAVLGDRYQLERELGQGGFGRTYLARDVHRFQEFCVLKEFAPQVQGAAALQKAQELFEREAGILYKLQHPQIPRFRELFRAQYNGQERLFLVQDYVEGRTYRSLLETRRAQGMTFSELEVTQFMTQLLPVLDYIHGLGVIHRDISPENVILRYSDQRPVLIDFGGVKQVAVQVSQYVGGMSIAAPDATRLGKIGYSPDEQMQFGKAYPHSDLYALAATALVLLTGQEPHTILPRGSIVWRSQARMSPGFAAILERMLSPQPSDRYPSAQAVLRALNGESALEPITQPPVSQPPLNQPAQSTPVAVPAPIAPPTQATVPVGQATTPAPILPVSSAPVAPKQGIGCGWWIGILAIILGSGIGGWWIANRFLLPPSSPDPVEEGTVEPDTDTPSTFSPEEQARKDALQQRREDLGVSQNWLIQVTNEQFYQDYPDQQGRTLTNAAEDAEWRSRWDAIASDWLDIVEANLSAEARAKLGSYGQADRDRWKQAVNQLYVGSRSLYDLADAKFFSLFPDQRGQDFLNTPIGQIWQAIAEDQVRSLQNGTNLSDIQFEPGTFSTSVGKTLEPGTGQVYTANLGEGQILRLNVQAPADSVLLSIYVPRPDGNLQALVEDSSSLVWSGTLPQSGYYEIVLVSQSDGAIAYELNLSVENVTTEEVQPAPQEAQPPRKD
jgi:serine/threonine-protein kinase